MPVKVPTRLRVVLSLVCVLVGVLALNSAPAFADTAPSITINPVSTFTATTAQLSGTVNPNGGPSATAWVFEYAKDPETEGWTPAYGGEFTGSEATGTSPIAVPVVPSTLEGLQPGTTYQARLVATNAGGETVSAEPNPSFTTPAVAPTIVAESTSTTEVTSSGAVLGAEINPGGGATTYHFEYDTSPYTSSAPHGQSTSESASIGADDSAHPASAPIGGLQAGTEYYFRVVAHSAAGGGAGSTVFGPDETFTTQATGSEFRLPDNRGWEQVSPVDKYGSRIEAITREGGVIQTAVDGSAITYVTVAPPVSDPQGNPSLDMSQIISTRGEDDAAGSEHFKSQSSLHDILHDHEVSQGY